MASEIYAIVKSGGKQYRVQRGQRLHVERLHAAVGETVALKPLLVRDGQVRCSAEELSSARVSARVLAHERGEKLRVFKFKPKRGYKRRRGHRQELTQIEISEIAAGAAKGESGDGA
ncbi:MAG TPA: 50S ribosomal protein L21 [Solirubrobacteraceae bacterium]|nr:50S ribosomal protein L21 [Solirubrobacteraceae bacterium]